MYFPCCTQTTHTPIFFCSNALLLPNKKLQINKTFIQTFQRNFALSKTIMMGTVRYDKNILSELLSKVLFSPVFCFNLSWTRAHAVSLQCLQVQTNLARASGSQSRCYKLPATLLVSLNPWMCHCVCQIILSMNLDVLFFIAPMSTWVIAEMEMSTV